MKRSEIQSIDTCLREAPLNAPSNLLALEVHTDDFQRVGDIGAETTEVARLGIL